MNRDADLPPTRVFVYGTLLAGEPNHRLLASARFVCDARTQPVFELRTLGPFPGMVPDGHQSVAGELYEVDAPTLAALDRLEGHPRFFRRTRITLEDGSGGESYVLDAEQARGCAVIVSGDWRRRGG